MESMNVGNFILIVDDEVHIAQLIADVLQDEGFQTRVCHNGSMALRSIRAQPPRLVLLDIGMPVMTGDELLQQLGTPDKRGFPVIVMTAANRPFEFIECGANEVLTKPFEIENLLYKVNDLIA
jgi:DNA-binding response OmpR family regulator